MRKQDENYVVRQNAHNIMGTLKSERVNKGLSLDKVANDLGTSVSYLSNIERLKVVPSFYSVLRYCDYLGLRIRFDGFLPW